VSFFKEVMGYVSDPAHLNGGDEQLRIERELKRLIEVDERVQSQHVESNARLDVLRERIKNSQADLEGAYDEGGYVVLEELDRSSKIALLYVTSVIEEERIKDDLRDYKPTYAVINGKKLPIVRKTHDDVYEVEFPNGNYHYVIERNTERLIYPGDEEEPTT
jgi:hypothetical protein